MSEWLDNQKQSNSSIRQMLQERIEKANPRRELDTEESKRLNKLEAIADKLKRGQSLRQKILKKLTEYCIVHLIHTMDTNTH